MTVVPIKLGVAARLAVLLGGLATASTLLALLLQDRALKSDLRVAAQDRLIGAAGAAERLLASHLSGVADRYSAISGTPEFRANLEADHLPTLTYYALTLAQEQSAAFVGFIRPSGVVGAAGGDTRLGKAAVDQVISSSGGVDSSCVSEAGRNRGALVLSGHQVRFAGCEFPAAEAEASLMLADGELHAVVSVPLRSRDALIGGLIALEPIGDRQMAVWSEISGADIGILLPGTAPSLDLQRRVRALPGMELWVSTTYEAERHAIARSRRNLVLAGLGSLLLAVIASLLLARRFARPILQIRSAAERAEAGFLDHDLDVRRDDELGDLGRAFKAMVSRLRGSELRLGHAQRLASLDHWSVEVCSGLVQGGTEFRRLFGLPHEGPIEAEDVVLCVHQEDRDRLRSALRRERGKFHLDVRVPLRPGRDRILHLRGQRNSEADGRQRVEASVQDVTLRWKTAKKIKYLSLHDTLTGLGNREYYVQHLRRRMKCLPDGSSLAVFTIGVNDFVNITGTVGHTLVDEMMREVSRRLVDVLSAETCAAQAGQESARDSAVRLGNAEFGAVVQVESRSEAAALAELILERLSQAHVVEGEEIAIDASIGICLWPHDADDIETLVRNGHAALERVRLIGRTRYQFYHGSMHREASRRMRMANLLRHAIENGELEVYYQPRVRPDSGTIVAVEALARWNSPELGEVQPSEFIPLAEESGLVQQLGDWSLRVAARDLAGWRELGATNLRVAVNISGHQLEPGLVRDVLEATSAVDTSGIELEVTESAVIDDPDEALAVLNELGRHGFRISLDDFGTGYSSLSYVRQLPIDAVKIDRSFIRELATSDEARSITWAIVMMCQALNLEAVAEGVETSSQRRHLIEMGCDEVQGYLFARPMPAPTLAKLLHKRGVLRFLRTVA